MDPLRRGRDVERARNGVTADRRYGSEACKADVNDPEYLLAMEMVTT